MVTRIGPRRPRHPTRHYILEWIAHRGIDQKTLADRMECSYGTLSKLISGRMERTERWMRAIADALELETWLDLYRDPARPTQNDLLRNMSEAERAAAIRVIRALTGTE